MYWQKAFGKGVTTERSDRTMPNQRTNTKLEAFKSIALRTQGNAETGILNRT